MPSLKESVRLSVPEQKLLRNIARIPACSFDSLLTAQRLVHLGVARWNDNFLVATDDGLSWIDENTEK